MKVGGTWLCVQSSNEVPHCHKGNVTKNTVGGPISPARWKWSLNSVYLFEGLLFTLKQMGREWSSQLTNMGLLGVVSYVHCPHQHSAGHCWTLLDTLSCCCHLGCVTIMQHSHEQQSWKHRHYARSSACVNWQSSTELSWGSGPVHCRVVWKC